MKNNFKEKLKKYAYKYIEFGWVILPLSNYSKNPGSILPSWKEFQTRKPTREEFENWFNRNDITGIGVLAGKRSGILVVDQDYYNPGAIKINLRTSVKVLTPNGGEQDYFKYSPEIPKLIDNKRHIEIRTGGNMFCVLPPSVVYKKDGKTFGEYRFEGEPDFTKLEKLDLILFPFPVKKEGQELNSDKFAPPNQGSRHRTLLAFAVYMFGQNKQEFWDEISDLIRTQAEKADPPYTDYKERKDLERIIEDAKKFVLENSNSYLNSKEKSYQNSLNPQVEWPEPIDEAAFLGIVGDVVKTIEPHSEADKAALLVNFLTGFGSIVGDRAHIKVEGDKHPMRFFAVLVGETSKGRKGTSWGQIKNLLEAIDQTWYDNLATGLSSGEGLIWVVRDKVVKNKTDKHGNTEEVVEDEGVVDKRALIIESEFSSPLKVIKREGNTLSPVVRNAWDSGNLRTLTKNSPTKATGAHISIIGHITKEELLRHLDDTEYANGFGNRFLWFCTKRSKVLPFGGKIDENSFLSLVSRLKIIVIFAQSVDEICWSEEAKALWIKIYPELSEGKSGLVGTLLGRAEAYVLRLAGGYTLLDSSKIIQPEHLKAAIAVWQYSEESVEYIFQSKVGDKIADEIYNILLESPDGLTKTKISDHFQRHKSSEELTKALNFLSNLNLVYSKEETTGRKIEIWFAKPISELRNKRKKRILDRFKKYEEELNSQNSHSQQQSNKIEDKNPDLPDLSVNFESLTYEELQIYHKALFGWLANCSPSYSTSPEFTQVMEQQGRVITEISKRNGGSVEN